MRLSRSTSIESPKTHFFIECDVSGCMLSALFWVLNVLIVILDKLIGKNFIINKYEIRIIVCKENCPMHCKKRHKAGTSVANSFMPAFANEWGFSMESKAKLFGHAIHPMLIVFPLGLLATSFVFDILSFAMNEPLFGTVSYWMITAGLIGGVLAAAFGLIDWLNIPEGTRARRIGQWHGIGNLVVVALFALSWFLRREDTASIPGTGAFVASLAAVAISLVTAWLGGELVERLRVGVDDGAHLDAPSSLSGPVPEADVRTSAMLGSTPEERLHEREIGR